MSIQPSTTSLVADSDLADFEITPELTPLEKTLDKIDQFVQSETMRPQGYQFEIFLTKLENTRKGTLDDRVNALQGISKIEDFVDLLSPNFKKQISLVKNGKALESIYKITKLINYFLRFRACGGIFYGAFMMFVYDKYIIGEIVSHYLLDIQEICKAAALSNRCFSAYNPEEAKQINANEGKIYRFLDKWVKTFQESSHVSSKKEVISRFSFRLGMARLEVECHDPVLLEKLDRKIEFVAEDNFALRRVIKGKDGIVEKRLDLHQYDQKPDYCKMKLPPGMTLDQVVPIMNKRFQIAYGDFVPMQEKTEEKEESEQVSIKYDN